MWDIETQEVHGGQTWRSLGENLVADFSVTTNAFGPPAGAVSAAAKALDHIHHYPAADCADAVTAVATFIDFPKDQVLLGNGASEFIDLVMRAAPPGPFRPGPYDAAYMEYNRAAKAAGRKVISSSANGEEAAITVIIRPNSPTGDMMSLPVVETIVNGTDGIVVLDESFIVFHGENWRSESALSLIAKYPQKLLALASWTKLWACPGLRLGSIAASAEWIKKLKRLQTPWSCSVPAQEFFIAACADVEYLRESWNKLPRWKELMLGHARALGWIANENSPTWVPWVYLNCGSKEVAASATEIAHRAGCPVRNCSSFGTPSHIRLGVRSPEAQDVLFAAWKEHFAKKDEPRNGDVKHGR